MISALGPFRFGQRVRALAVLVAGVVCSCGSAAAAADWSRLSTQLLQPVAVENQLPNSAVPMALASDSQGYLWVGTQNGLARWDGLQFRIFGAGGGADSLPDSQINTLHADSKGRLWIGMVSAGLASYDPRSGSFNRYVARKSGYRYAGVSALEDAPGGRLWVGSDSGLDAFDPADGGFVHVQAKGELREALASGINALAAGRGELWIGSNHGLLRRDGRTGAVTAVRLGPGAEPSIRALLLDTAGRLWVGTDGAGAFVIDPGTGQGRPVPGSVHAGLLGSGMRVRALMQLSPGEVWLGTYDDGVLSVDPATLASHRVRLGAGSLLYGDQTIHALFHAADGQVFVAAHSALTRYDPRHPAFEVLIGGQAPTAALAERNPLTLSKDAQGRIWSGFVSHGADVVDPRTAKVIHLKAKPGGLPEAPVRQFTPDGKGMLLATDSGLYTANADSGRVRRLNQPGRAPDSPVMTLLADGDRLWVGGRDGVQTYRRGPDDRLSPEMLLPNARLSDRRVNVLRRDARGSIWIGTSRGLNVFDPVRRKLVALEPGPGDNATPSGFISSVSLDHRGRLWVTTFGRGLSVAESVEAAEAHRFRRIDLADGLPNSNANLVLEDERGMIWASTDSGLARIDPDTLKVEPLQLPQGVALSSFFYNAGLIGGPDDLLFAARGGMQVVHPSLYRTLHQIPPLRITEVHEHGRILPGDPFLALPPGQPLHLPPGGGGLEVGFAALDYGAPERVRYAYRLLGATNAWTEVDANRRLASFNNLAPGAYTLEIRASDPAEGWTPQVLRLPVLVAPAWDQTWWFHLAEVLAATAVVLLLVRWRTSALTRRRRELEAMVEERTHELQAQKDVLETQAVQLAEARTRAETLAQAKSDFLANMSHEIRTPLNGVVAVADLLARADLPAKERGMAEIIRASGDTLQRLLSDILDMARIESGKITIESAPFHAGDMVRAVAGLSQLKCEEKGVRLLVQIDPALDRVVDGDMVRVRQVVTNLLSNAVKFTDRGEVRLLAERLEDGRARFTVTDTGVGFPMADKSKVLGRFEQADSSITRRFGGTGLGLSICCNLAQLMGGALDCDSEPGAGSRFWMELPLEDAACESAVDDDAFRARQAAGEDAPLRVLVADDHPTNRQVVQLMLADMADLTCVEDGRQALEAFAQSSFDVILMDMQMPVMDGLTALREIRRSEEAAGQPRTPAVMLTANALPEHVASAEAAGADLHLSKPFTAADLFGALDEALAGRDRKRERERAAA